MGSMNLLSSIIQPSTDRVAKAHCNLAAARGLRQNHGAKRASHPTIPISVLPEYYERGLDHLGILTGKKGRAHHVSVARKKGILLEILIGRSSGSHTLSSESDRNDRRICQM